MRPARGDLALYAAVAAGALGAALRVLHYAERRSLWLDEAMLALNVVPRSFAELTRPLDYGQAAPVLFLWAERAMVRLAGPGELALRLVPLIAGLALLPALWAVASRLLPRGGGAVAVALAALSPILVYYSTEVKPYAVDALVTVLLLWAGLAALDRPADARAWRRLWAGGAVAIWLASPAVFVLAGVGLALLASAAVRGAPGGWRRIAATAGVWGAAFAAAFLTFYRSTAENAYMQRFWEGTFMTFDPPGLPVRLAKGVGAMLVSSLLHADIFAATVPALRNVAALAALLLCAAGAVAIGRRNGASAAILVVGPVAAALAASAGRLYPVADRLMTYAAPLVILMAAAGVAAVAARLAPPAATAVASALLLVPSGYHAAYRLGVPEREEAPRAVIADLLRRRQPSEPVYVFARSMAQWMFYTTDWSAPDTARLRYAAEITRAPTGPAFYNPERGDRPVVDEGAELVYASGARREVYGVGSGIGNDAIDRRRPPSDGWAANEVGRMRREAAPCVWLLLSAVTADERQALLRGLTSAGGRTVYRRSESRTQARRVCFSGSASGATAPPRRPAAARPGESPAG